MKVSDIAKVSSGLIISRKKANYTTDIIKMYKQLNLMSINKNGYINLDKLEDLPVKESINSEYLTNEGDIVIRLTAPFTAVYIKKEYENIVISSNFCIVRCGEKYCREYLSYYLNSDKTKKSLFSNLQGTIMNNINMSAVADIEIPNIPIEKQKILGKVLSAQKEKLILLEKIKELEEKQQKFFIDTF